MYISFEAIVRKLILRHCGTVTTGRKNFKHPLRSHWESFREGLLIKLQNQNIFEKLKLNRNLQTILVNMMHNTSMLRWGGGGGGAP